MVKRQRSFAEKARKAAMLKGATTHVRVIRGWKDSETGGVRFTDRMMSPAADQDLDEFLKSIAPEKPS